MLSRSTSTGNVEPEPQRQPPGQELEANDTTPFLGRVYYYRVYESTSICCVGTKNFSLDQIDEINGCSWPSNAGDPLHIIEDASPELVASLRAGKATEDMLFRLYLQDKGVYGLLYKPSGRVPPFLPFFSRQVLTVRWFKPVSLEGRVTQEIMDPIRRAELANGDHPVILKHRELNRGYRELRTVSKATNIVRPWWSIPFSDDGQCSEGYWEEVVTLCREYNNGSCRSE